MYETYRLPLDPAASFPLHSLTLLLSSPTQVAHPQTHPLESHPPRARHPKEPPVIAPQITSWEQLLGAYELVNEATGVFKYTKFVAVEDDMIFYGQLNKPKADISFQEVTDALARIPDEEIFPQ